MAGESRVLSTGMMGYFLDPDRPQEEYTNFPIILGVSETADGLPIGSGALAYQSAEKARYTKGLETRLKALEETVARIEQMLSRLTEQ
jgi:hypothetical protein